MAPSRFDNGTGGTNYSSIHSVDAFVGTYQVMYTPGANSPQSDLPQKKSTRFSKATTARSHHHSQSFILPTNIPNTSQIVADQGSLPNVQIHYSVPADEKQIVASLRALQRDLNEAMQTINTLTRERDEALLELRMLRVASKKQAASVKKATRAVSQDEDEELFDLSRSMESPKVASVRRTSSKRSGAESNHNVRTTVSDDARILSPVDLKHAALSNDERHASMGRSNKAHGKAQTQTGQGLNDTENSAVGDLTAASNTSRRRRHLDLDANMTSAYIIPDITVNHTQPAVSRNVQNVLHRHDPDHIQSCEVCQRLTTTKKTKHVTHASTTSKRPTSNTKKQSAASKEQDFTAQITQLMKSAMLDEPTVRPKISPWQALANVKKLLTDQFEEAKRKHGLAWEEYDGIEAPRSSKRHAAISEELFYWSKKMEECRLNLDQLRDVEEGMSAED